MSTPLPRSTRGHGRAGIRTRKVSVTLACGSQPVALNPHHVELVVRALRAAGSGAAASIADEISALALAGVRIDLLPTRDELQALIDALVRLQATAPSPDPAIARILTAARSHA